MKNFLYASPATRVVLAIVAIALLVASALVGEYFLFGVASTASQIAQVAQQDQRALCESGNTARAQQIELWQYIIGLSSPPKTPQQKQNVALFEAYLKTVFKPRDCNP